MLSPRTIPLDISTVSLTGAVGEMLDDVVQLAPARSAAPSRGSARIEDLSVVMLPTHSVLIVYL